MIYCFYEGYSGVMCNIKADPCTRSTCGTVATCTASATEYICQCDQGKIFSGTKCYGTLMHAS